MYKKISAVNDVLQTCNRQCMGVGRANKKRFHFFLIFLFHPVRLIAFESLEDAFHAHLSTYTPQQFASDYFLSVYSYISRISSSGNVWTNADDHILRLFLCFETQFHA